jgi:hypothetical protein
MPREPQPEKGMILLICFEAMFERMSLFSCPQAVGSVQEAFGNNGTFFRNYSGRMQDYYGRI